MEKFLTFLADNYIWFLVGAAILLLTLIGFIVDSKKKKTQGESYGGESSAEESFFETPAPETIVEQPQNDFKAVSNEVIEEMPQESQLNTNETSFESIDLFSEAPASPMPPEPEVTFDATNAINDEPIISTPEAPVETQKPIETIEPTDNNNFN